MEKFSSLNINVFKQSKDGDKYGEGIDKSNYELIAILILI